MILKNINELTIVIGELGYDVIIDYYNRTFDVVCYNYDIYKLYQEKDLLDIKDKDYNKIKKFIDTYILV